MIGMGFLLEGDGNFSSQVPVLALPSKISQPRISSFLGREDRDFI